MNGGGYLLGGLWLTKLLVRWRTGYSPSRWGTGENRWPVVMLVVLTVLLLAWCLVSALNARATYLWAELRFDYRDGYIPWLPHSYDAPRSWFAFWTYLGLGLTFWAARDWLLGKTRRERFAEPDIAAGAAMEPRAETSLRKEASGSRVPRQLPARLRLLLWVLCLNGALLGLEGILQRFEGTNKLLWLVEPRINNTPDAQFGPYAYRGNAAQYFNLLWPVCLGFWWCLHREVAVRVNSRRGEGPHLLLLPCAVIMAMCPFVAASRGGALVAAGNLCLALVLLLLASRREDSRAGWSFLAAFLILGALIGYLGWENLYARVSAPSYAYSTGHNAEIDEITLHCVFRAPVENPKMLGGLVGVSSSKSRLNSIPHSLWVAVAPDGSLAAQFYGDEGTNYVSRIVPGFVRAYAGQQVDLSLVKTTNLVLFLNGVEVPTVDASWGNKGILTNSVSAAYLWVGRLNSHVQIYTEPIYSATVFNGELTGSELRRNTDRLPKGEPEPTEVALSDEGPRRRTPILEVDLLSHRFGTSLRTGLDSRNQIYRGARQMAADYPWFGSGPGTFYTLSSFYHVGGSERIPAYVHDDWLETRATFGRLGLGLILLAMALPFVRWLVPGEVQIHWVLSALLCLSLGGCLVHAKFDFPLQIHSVLFLFLLVSCMAFSASRRA